MNNIINSVSFIKYSFVTKSFNLNVTVVRLVFDVAIDGVDVTLDPILDPNKLSACSPD